MKHAGLALSIAALCSLTGPASAEPTATATVHLRLRTGGEISGLVVDHDDHALVIVRDQTPYVFSWREMELASALRARRAALALSRGGEDKLTAGDWFTQGQLALRHHRNDAAVVQFREAEKRDSRLSPRIGEVLDEFRRARRDPDGEGLFADGSEADDGDGSDHTESGPWTKAVPPPGPDVESQLGDAYLQFGTKVQEVLGKDVSLLESEHFLVWTDWEKRYHARLPAWCEAMYDALRRQFDLRPDELVFPAKCPVFCFRSKARFRKFARYFDAYDGVSSVGYTRSVERHGHVHVVLLRQGKTELDFDAFACTLVHEGTHAFVHRLYTHRLIPHWVNEGLAELMAERVLGDRCDAGETARLLAKQYARYDWPLSGFFESPSAVDVHQYPLAHSVVAYLESLGEPKFASFVRSLKEGRSTPEALSEVYGLTFAELERDWKSAIGPQVDLGSLGGTGRQ